MTEEEVKKYESIPNRKYYVLTEDVPCWHWLRNEDNTFDWSIISYNSKEVSPRKEIPEEVVITQEEIANIFAMRFHLWMLENDTEENAERFFHYQLTDMLNEFKKEMGL